MKVKNIPFNITFLDSKQQTVAGLLPVTQLDIYDGNTHGHHPRGLYSDAIFGRVGTPERNTRHGYINLRTRVLHPKAYEELTRLGGPYKGIMQGKVYAKWDEKTKNFIKSDILDGKTGYSFFMSHFDDIKFTKNKSQKRSLRVDLLNKYRSQSKIHFFIVMPAGLRDIRIAEGGRPIEEDINKLYRKILISANGIPDNMSFKEDPMLDSVRWNIQTNVQAVWDTIMGMLSGKNGFLQAKWGSRRVVHGTRNVITAMDPGSAVLGGPTSFDNSGTILGLNQTLRGVEPLITRFAMPNGIASDLINGIDGDVPLVNIKTLKGVSVHPSEKERTRWGTVDGRASLIGHHAQKENRHTPVIVDGMYLKLIYQDDAGFRLLSSIDELPEDKDKNKVRPLTWAEYFYLTLDPYMKRIRCHVTRYPITGTESNYPSIPILRTTVTALRLKEYNSNFEIDDNSRLYLEFPDTLNKLEFVDSAAPNTSQLPNLGADEAYGW